MHAKSRLVRLFSTTWTIARQAPLSMGFSWQEYWSGMPCPPPGDLPDPWIEPVSLKSPALAGRLFTTSTTWEVPLSVYVPVCLCVCISYVFNPLICVGRLGCFCILAVVNNAAVNIGAPLSLWDLVFIPLVFIPKNGIAGSYGSSVFKFLRNFHSGCTNVFATAVHKGSFSPHPHLPLSLVV